MIRNRLKKVTYYKIVCSKTGRCYIGQTTNPKKRMSVHMWNLRRNAHANSAFQADFDAYGESSFAFEVIEQGLTSDPLPREAQLIKSYGPKAYNIQHSFVEPENVIERRAANIKAVNTKIAGRLGSLIRP